MKPLRACCAKFIASFFALLASGCATLPGTTTAQIGNRRVEYAMVSHDTVPVVFENGLGATMAYWKKVFPEIAREYTAFAYNRPGYGKSDPVSTPRDGAHVVDELRTLLQNAGLKPPYILVGHSLGGLYMQQFARRYPSEVAALVLVDSTHPNQAKGKGAPENWPAWFRLLFKVAASDVVKNEMGALDTTGEAVLNLPPFTGKPVILLSALQPMNDKSELALDANEKRKDLSRLYPGAKQVWVDSGHNMQREKPEAVIAAIREVLSLSAREGPASLK